MGNRETCGVVLEGGRLGRKESNSYKVHGTTGCVVNSCGLFIIFSSKFRGILLSYLITEVNLEHSARSENFRFGVPMICATMIEIYFLFGGTSSHAVLVSNRCLVTEVYYLFTSTCIQLYSIYST